MDEHEQFAYSQRVMALDFALGYYNTRYQLAHLRDITDAAEYFLNWLNENEEELNG